MGSRQINLSDEARNFCLSAFGDLRDRSSGVYGALMSTVDGHEVVFDFRKDMPANKISAMTSSMLALGESLAKEAELELCRFVITQNSNGIVVILRIGEKLLLTCMADQQTNLGMLLSSSRAAADAIAEKIKAS